MMTHRLPVHEANYWVSNCQDSAKMVDRHMVIRNLEIAMVRSDNPRKIVQLDYRRAEVADFDLVARFAVKNPS